MSQIREWAERVFRVVEMDGQRVTRVRLVSGEDNGTWETWHAPFGTPDEFEIEVQTVVRRLENEFPARSVSVTLEADAPNGETLHKYPFRIVGKAKQGVLDAGQAAQAVVFNSLALTIEKLQQLTNTQLDQARMLIAQQNELISELAQDAYRSKRKRAQDEPSETVVAVVEAVTEHLPTMLELAKLALHRPQAH